MSSANLPRNLKRKKTWTRNNENVNPITKAIAWVYKKPLWIKGLLIIGGWCTIVVVSLMFTVKIHPRAD